MRPPAPLHPKTPWPTQVDTALTAPTLHSEQGGGEVSETAKILGAIAELRTDLRAEIAELRTDMNERFEHLAEAVDRVVVRLAQLTNGDDWK